MKGRLQYVTVSPSTIESFSNKNYLDEPQDRIYKNNHNMSAKSTRNLKKQIHGLMNLERLAMTVMPRKQKRAAERTNEDNLGSETQSE